MSIETKLSKIGKALDKFFSKCHEKFAILFLEKKYKKHRVERKQPVLAQVTILILDSLIAFLSIFVAIELRIGEDFSDYSILYIVKNMLVFGLVSASVFLWGRTNLPFWKYTSNKDIVQIFLSSVIANIAFSPLMTLMNQEDFLPYSILIINIFILSFMLLAPRILSYFFYMQKVSKEKRFDLITNSLESSAGEQPVLLIGTPQSAEIFLQELLFNEDIQFDFHPIGIFSISEVEIGRTVGGVEILGEVRSLSRVLKTLHQKNIFPRQIIITEKSMPEHIKNFILKYSANNGLILMHATKQCSFKIINE